MEVICSRFRHYQALGGWCEPQQAVSRGHPPKTTHTWYYRYSLGFVENSKNSVWITDCNYILLCRKYLSEASQEERKNHYDTPASISIAVLHGKIASCVPQVTSTASGHVNDYQVCTLDLSTTSTQEVRKRVLLSQHDQRERTWWTWTVFKN